MKIKICDLGVAKGIIVEMKKALITGINSQDGSYLAELLLGKGYEVHGTIRRSSIENSNKISNIKSILDKIHIHTCYIDDHLSIYKLISMVKPDECYHLAASSFVSYSFDDEVSTISTNFNSTHYILSSIKELVPDCRFYFAGSSELFGDANVFPQNEGSRFNPRSIYGISKLASYYVVKNYRESHGLYACTGIAYNHESPRRSPNFVTKKITSGIAKIIMGQKDCKLELGNIDAIRDWGYAADYVEAMWKILNNTNGPKDYVIATGISHTVKDFLKLAFSFVDLDYRKFTVINEKFFRSSEKIPLIGDATRIQEDLNWKPKKDFNDIVKEMVFYDIMSLKGEIQ